MLIIHYYHLVIISIILIFLKVAENIVINIITLFAYL